MNSRGQGLSRPISGQAIVILAGLAAIVALCWWYLFEMAAGMGMMALGDMVAFKTWTVPYFFMMLVMWSVMMVAMMIPSATPMIMLYRRVAVKNRQAGALLGVLLFAGGYVVIWTGFSALATAMQWALEQVALLNPMMRSQSLVFSGAVLLIAGLYQWSPWKRACLRHCRGPIFFITQQWRPGPGGAFRMGLVHGAYCVGCCSTLMALLFVGGVMDLTVVALIAIVVLLEKVLPGGEQLAKALGVLSILGGIYILGSGLIG